MILRVRIVSSPVAQIDQNILSSRRKLLRPELIKCIESQPLVVWPAKLGKWDPPNYPTVLRMRQALLNPNNGYRHHIYDARSTTHNTEGSESDLTEILDDPELDRSEDEVVS